MQVSSRMRVRSILKRTESSLVQQTTSQLKNVKMTNDETKPTSKLSPEIVIESVKSARVSYGTFNVPIDTFSLSSSSSFICQQQIQHNMQEEQIAYGRCDKAEVQH